MRLSLLYHSNQITKHYYDGRDDDLATAGLGLQGLRGAPPSFSHPLSPSRQELRRSAIYHNIRQILSVDESLGFGRLYGRYMVGAEGELRVPGYELVVPLRYSDHSIAATVLLQIPDSFDWERPCLAVGAASGSRGLYGAAGVIGMWALEKRCAVVVTDKGTGAAFFWPTENLAVNIDGSIEAPNTASHFFTGVESALARAFPHRVATKHAHNGRQEDRYWGDFVLAAVDIAFDLLRREFPDRPALHPRNTLVMGAAISNGGGAVLKAAERDTQRRFDGIVLSEPNIPVPVGYTYQWQENGQIKRHSTDYLVNVAFTQALYLPCAALFHDSSMMPAEAKAHWSATFSRRCGDLRNLNLLRGDSLREQSAESLRKLEEKGYSTNSNPLALMFSRNLTWNGLLMNYTYSLGGFTFDEHLCGLSYAHVDSHGRPKAMPLALKNHVFTQSSGMLPGVGITIINDNDTRGPHSLLTTNWSEGVSDLGLKNMRCMGDYLESEPLQQALHALHVTGDLQGLPAIIVHGEADNIVQVKNTSRPYVVLNAKAEAYSNVHYYEVNNAQHLDRIVAYPLFKQHFVPLQYYFESALDIMFAHLTDGTEIPSSRQVLAEPVASVDADITPQQLPAIISHKVRPIRVDGDVLVFSP